MQQEKSSKYHIVSPKSGRKDAFIFLALPLFSPEDRNSQQSHEHATHWTSRKLDGGSHLTQGSGHKNGKVTEPPHRLT